MASWLMRSTEERTVRIWVLAGDIVLYFLANHCNLTVPLSTQVYEWVLVNLMQGVTLPWTCMPSRGQYKGGNTLGRFMLLKLG